MSFPRYPKYKASGVEWLGDVPEGWEVSALRRSINAIFNGISAPQIDEDETTVPVTRIETISFGSIDESRMGYIAASDARKDRKLQVGDILFSNINSLNMIGNCAYYFGGREIYAGMNLLVLRPQKLRHARWLYWVIRSPIFRRVVESLAKPSVNQASIPQSSIIGIIIGSPPLPEQTAIAEFLDRETAKIDGLVAEQRRLMELLKEKRQAVISHALTKGLNPHGPMKPSGIEWLGEVPEGWSVAPFKRQIARNDGGVWGDDPDGISDTIVLRSTEQTVDGRWQLDNPASRKLSGPDIDGALLDEGDLLLTKSSGSSLHIGKTTLVTAEIAEMRCCYSNFMQRIRTKPTFLPKLAWYVLNNQLARQQLDLVSNSTTGLANLNATMVGQLVVIVPPLCEQTAIAEFLDTELAKFDTLTAEAQRAIDLLQERRTALISAAVTGQIDVRGIETREFN